MADTTTATAWRDPPFTRPAFSAGVGRALVPGRASNDTPKYIFEGTVSTESQRASRGVLEHWANRISTGFDVTAPIVSAAALKLFNQNSSAGKALKFPPQLLGDVFADPNLDSGKARLAAAAERRAKAAANAEAKIMLGEWSVASRQDKELKAVFGAMKKGEASVNVSAEGETVDVPQITQFFKPAVVPDGTITHFYKTTDDKFSFEVVGETIERIGGKPNCPVPFTAPLRVLPNVKYADCDASRPANGDGVIPEIFREAASFRRDGYAVPIRVGFLF